jgi:hypothetical protein
MTRPLLHVALLALTLACSSAPRTDVDAATGGLALPALGPASVPRWRDHLAPADDELAFESVGWLTSFADGMAAADAEQRPLFFWAMNGHPLGCT